MNIWRELIKIKNNKKSCFINIQHFSNAYGQDFGSVEELSDFLIANKISG